MAKDIIKMRLELESAKHNALNDSFFAMCKGEDNLKQREKAHRCIIALKGFKEAA